MKNKQSINKQHMLAPSVIKSLSKNIFKNAHKIGLNITSQSGALEFTSQLFGAKTWHDVPTLYQQSVHTEIFEYLTNPKNRETLYKYLVFGLSNCVSASDILEILLKAPSCLEDNQRVCYKYIVDQLKQSKTMSEILKEFMDELSNELFVLEIAEKEGNLKNGYLQAQSLIEFTSNGGVV